MTYLLFAVALSLSAIAAYYAVMGLIAIFAAAVVPIAIMGSLLEVSKLTVASWLYQNWKRIPTLLKTYFTIALVVLMLLTSMGIFGFLSKAHLDQAVPTGDVAAKLAMIDEKIKTEKENLNASRQELNQLDQQVNETISRSANSTSGGTSGVERSIAIRKSQQKDRARILSEIGTSQAKISKLQEERSPIASEVRKVEAEVGPIKYIAALIYGDSIDEGLLEKAVRIVTIMIVIVFDPLAVLLLIAANWNLRNGRNESWTSLFLKPPAVDFPEKEPYVEPVPVPEPSVEPLVGEEALQTLKDAGIVTEENQLSPEYGGEESEIPEIQVDEATKEWEPELYQRLQEKNLGRYQAETQPMTQSFLNKVKAFLKTPTTIEQEVESLQDKNPK